MIDIWMLFTMTVPFLEVVLHTTNEVFVRRASHVGPDKRIIGVKPAVELEEEEEEPSKTRNRMRSILRILTNHLKLPLSSLIFTISFWVVGLSLTYSSDSTQDSNMTDCLVIDLN